jgi:5-methylcytosine-specific restriction endonuclease McrA
MSDPIPTEKRCTKCDEIKPVSAFSKQKSRKDGHQIYCKVCHKQYSTTYIKANEDHILQRNLPEQKRCTKCGEVKPLDEFALRKGQKDGRRNECKACKSQIDKAYRTTNADAKRANDRAYQIANADKIREYKKNYRANNIDKLREKDRAYREANKDKLRGQHQAYYRAHSEAIRARVRAYNKANFEVIRVKRQAYRAANMEAKRIRDRAYRDANREAVRAYHRAYQEAYADRIYERHLAYRAANFEKIKAYLKAYRAANPDVFRAAIHRRRARIKENGGDFSPQELIAMRKTQNGICAYCKGQYDPDDLSIDHVIPIKQAGPHQASNIVLACLICNMNKGNRTPEQWTNRWYLRKPKEDHGTEE